MAWNTNPKGIYLDSHRYVQDESKLSNVDFIIANMGAGAALDERFTQHIQTAANVHKPLIGYYCIDMTQYAEYQLNNYDRWPAGTGDPSIKVIEQAIMTGGVKRTVHAIMLDITWVQNATDNWVKQIGERVLDLAWKRYKLPVYIFATMAMVQKYPGSEVLPTWLSGLGTISSWMSAFTASALDPLLIDWTGIPVPADGYKPEYVYAKGVDFFRYANTKYALPGIVGASGQKISTPLWMFNGNLTNLHSDLGYVASDPSTPTTPDPGTGTPIPETGTGADLTATNAKLQTIIDMLEPISAFCARFK